MKSIAFAALTSVVLALSSASLAQAETDIQEHDSDRPQSAYVPGLGDIMGATQMRHAKLWFAGQNGNWQLAGYELGEIKEGFEVAVTLHPNFMGVPVSSLITAFTAKPLDALVSAIAARSKDDFTKAFDQLTSGCNGCHHAANKPFIVINRPSVPPVSNQVFG